MRGPDTSSYARYTDSLARAGSSQATAKIRHPPRFIYLALVVPVGYNELYNLESASAGTHPVLHPAKTFTLNV